MPNKNGPLREQSIKVHRSMKWKTLNKKNQWCLSLDNWRAVIEQTVLTFTRHCNASRQLSGFTLNESVLRIQTCLLAYYAHEQMMRWVYISISALWIRWPAVTAHHTAAFHSSQGLKVNFRTILGDCPRILLSGIIKSMLTNENGALVN